MRVPIKTKHFTIYVHDSGAWLVRNPDNWHHNHGHAKNKAEAIKAGKKACAPHAYTIVECQVETSSESPGATERLSA